MKNIWRILPSKWPKLWIPSTPVVFFFFCNSAYLLAALVLRQHIFKLFTVPSAKYTWAYIGKTFMLVQGESLTKKNWPQFCSTAKNGQQSRRYRELTNCFFYFIPELPFYQAKLHLGSSRLFLTQNWPKKTDLNSGGDQKERSTEQIQIRADKVLFLRII